MLKSCRPSEPRCNFLLLALMTQEDKQALLPANTLEASVNVNGNNPLQRRRNSHKFNPPNSNNSHFLANEENPTTSPLLLPTENQTITKKSFNFKKVFMLLGAYLGVGTLCFFLIRNQIEGKKTNGFVDSLYFCVVTMTTVGYGDLVPHRVYAKLLACTYVFTGMAFGGLFLSKAADKIVENQEILLVKAFHLNEQCVDGFETVHKHNKHKFLVVLLALVVLMVLGTLFLYLVENLGFVNAIYCVCCTITTLGYGDESFSTERGRIFAVFWILSSTICLAQCFLYLAELYTERRQRKLVQWVMSRKFTWSDLEAADLDHDKVVR